MSTNVYMILLSLVTVSFLVSVLLTQHFTQPQALLYILDKPSARSLHTRPIPLSGGVAILTGFTLSAALSTLFYPQTPATFWMAVGGLMIATISFIDDWRLTPPLLRLAIHFIAAFLALHYGNLWLIQLTFPGITWELSGMLQVGFSLLFVVWMVNLYNFMDGMDGFAGGMALFGFGTLALLGVLAGEWFFMALNLLIASAVVGFLVFNFPPAKIFMGDAGSSSLGFLAACFSLWADHADIIPLWMSILLFSPFIVDATVTLLRRIFKGEKFWQPHKTHYYQRLVQLGWGHRRTVLCEYQLMAACSVSTVVASFLPVYAQGFMICAWIGIYSGLIYGVKRLEQQR